MPIQYRCDRCGIWLSISRKKIGQPVACPHCAASKVIPAEDEPRLQSGSAPLDATASPAVPDDEIVFSEVVDQQVSAPAPVEISSAVPIDRPDEFATWSEPVDDVPPSAASAVAPPQERPPTPPVPPTLPTSSIVNGDDLPIVEFKRRPRDTEEMDLTPMVDMTFLLLIFFMITASLQLQKSLEMPAPNPDQTGAQQSQFTPEQLEQTCIRVSIDAENRVMIEDEPVAGPDQILERLKMQMRTTQRYELVVAADPAAFHESVVAVIDAAQTAGMEKIRMIGSSSEF
jgi:biopolymer transport protein ExbD